MTVHPIEHTPWTKCLRYFEDTDSKCGKPAVDEVFIKTPATAVKVPLCEEHIAEHKKRAMQFRHKGKERSKPRS